VAEACPFHLENKKGHRKCPLALEKKSTGESNEEIDTFHAEKI